MKVWTRVAVILMFVPLIASAQYRDMDTASSHLERGFTQGNAQMILAGIGEGEKVMLQFPGLVDQSGFFGRDQAAYLLDGLFNRARPVSFEQTSTRKVSAEGQYYITATWTVQVEGKSEARDLYITLRTKDDRWAIVSIRSASK